MYKISPGLELNEKKILLFAAIVRLPRKIGNTNEKSLRLILSILPSKGLNYV